MAHHTPQQIAVHDHPLISAVYLMTDIEKENDVLVIETVPARQFKGHMNELLADLPFIALEAEEKAGPFARIDIRTH